MESHRTTIFDRTTQLIGQTGMNHLKNSHVAIVGMGAVGSFATENLARSGIGELTIIDFDTITPTNINRQIPALHSTVGQTKVNVMAQRLQDINPSVKIHAIQEFFEVNTFEKCIPSDCDYIIDAIDSYTPKLNLLKIVCERQLSVISSMGAAGRLDPTRVSIAWLPATQICPLAKRLRKGLRRLGTDFSKVISIYSSEIPQKPLPPEVIDPEITRERGRKRSVNGSICYLPAIFGCYISAVVINALIEGKSDPDFCRRLLNSQ